MEERVLVYEGDALSREFDHIAEKFDLYMDPQHGFLSEDPNVEVLNIDGEINGKDYPHHVIVQMWCRVK